MNIKVAVPQDASAIANVHVASWQQAYRELLPQDFLGSLSVAERESVWSTTIAKGNVEVLVVETAGQIIGFSAFGHCRDPGAPHMSFEIYAIYLDPGYWSQGIGYKLWVASHKVLKLKKADTVCLWVLAGNNRAIRFYKDAGFELIANSEKELEMGGVKLQKVKYAQRIDG